MNWHTVLDCLHPEAALVTFMKLLSAVCHKHAPIKKLSIRSAKPPWIDNELKRHIKERNLSKKSAIENGSPAEWQAYRSLRNKIIKMNKQKRTLNVVGKCKVNKTSTLIECDGVLITKPKDIANYFGDYFMNKVGTIRTQMLPGHGKLSDSIIKKEMMWGKECGFRFGVINEEDLEKLLLSIKCDNPCGIDNLDARSLQLSARIGVRPIFHISICVLIDVCFLSCGRLQR